MVESVGGGDNYLESNHNEINILNGGLVNIFDKCQKL